MIHACLKCKHSDDFEKPISMTDASTVHMGFTCRNPCTQNAYGQLCTNNAMILDLEDQDVWVDGSLTIPAEGCANFVKAENVNQ